MLYTFDWVKYSRGEKLIDRLTLHQLVVVWLPPRTRNMAFVAKCKLCDRNCKTGYSLHNHHRKHHLETDYCGGDLYEDGHRCTDIPRPITVGIDDDYKEWISIITMRINGTFNPRARSEYFTSYSYRNI